MTQPAPRTVHEEGKQVLQPGSFSKSYDFSFFLELSVLTPGAQGESTLDISAILTLSCSLIPP